MTVAVETRGQRQSKALLQPLSFAIIGPLTVGEKDWAIHGEVFPKHSGPGGFFTAEVEGEQSSGRTARILEQNHHARLTKEFVIFNVRSQRFYYKVQTAAMFHLRIV